MSRERCHGVPAPRSSGPAGQPPLPRRHDVRYEDRAGRLRVLDRAVLGIQELGAQLSAKNDFEWWAWHPHIYSDGAPETAYQQAIVLFEEEGNSLQEQAACHYNLGHLYLGMNRPGRAVTAYENALGLFCRIPGSGKHLARTHPIPRRHSHLADGCEDARRQRGDTQLP